MNELAYVNGDFCELSEARVSIEDRGFQFADSVYEVIVAYSGRPFQLNAHLARLRRSCEAVALNFDFQGNSIEDIINEGLRRTGLKDAMVYVQVTRGVAPRAHAIPADMSPSLVMTFKPKPSLPDALRQSGARVMSTLETRWANCYIKSTMLLPNVLARQEAKNRGFDDALFVTSNGEVRECTSANVFMVHEGILVTPQLTDAVLHGITQHFLRDCAEGIGIGTREEAIHLDQFRSADEAFMCSTVGEVLGIVSVDGQNIGNGQVGLITRRIYDRFLRYARGA